MSPTFCFADIHHAQIGEPVLIQAMVSRDGHTGGQRGDFIRANDQAGHETIVLASQDHQTPHAGTMLQVRRKVRSRTQGGMQAALHHRATR
jgi:hypothetical protein